jgi:pilus assembly protein Flp/PilA
MIIANFLKDLGKDKSGGTAIEYGLIVSLIVIAISASLSSMAGETIDMWDNVAGEVRKVTGP